MTPPDRTWWRPLGCLLTGAVLWTSGCTALPQVATPPQAEQETNGVRTPVPVRLPPTGALDYQLGGAYDPPETATIVTRDRLEKPAPGRYSICYVNGFQTQPDDLDAWPEATLLLADGELVTDPDWPDEVLLDISHETARSQVFEIVAPWIDDCAEAGFDAIEFDNLDTYSRSGGAVSRANALELAAVYSERAHARGLAVGQKNAAEDAAELQRQAGFDFAMTEECAAYEECDAYTDVYGSAVLDVEYTDTLPRSFAQMCADPASPATMTLRDRDLVIPTDEGYTFETCE